MPGSNNFDENLRKRFPKTDLHYRGENPARKRSANVEMKEENLNNREGDFFTQNTNKTSNLLKKSSYSLFSPLDSTGDFKGERKGESLRHIFFSFSFLCVNRGTVLVTD